MRSGNIFLVLRYGLPMENLGGLPKVDSLTIFMEKYFLKVDTLFNEYGP